MPAGRGAFWAATTWSNMLDVWPKSLGSTTVEGPFAAYWFIMSIHWVNSNRRLASPSFISAPLMVSMDSLMPRAMAMRWSAMPLPSAAMASAFA